MDSRRYPFLDYLGALSNEDLRREAATWACFAHPLFCPAKGCSTKLGVGLGWGLPIATTALGTRGYVWNRALAPVAESPTELADIVLQQCRVAGFSTNCRVTSELVRNSPTIGEVGSQIRDFVLNLPVGAR